MAVVCNPIRMGRWFELMVVCVFHSDEVMRERLMLMIHLENWGRHYQGVLWVNLYLGMQSWKYLPNPPVDCLSNRLFRSVRVNGEH